MLRYMIVVVVNIDVVDDNKVDSNTDTIIH